MGVWPKLCVSRSPTGNPSLCSILLLPFEGALAQPCLVRHGAHQNAQFGCGCLDFEAILRPPSVFLRGSTSSPPPHPVPFCPKNTCRCRELPASNSGPARQGFPCENVFFSFAHPGVSLIFFHGPSSPPRVFSQVAGLPSSTAPPALAFAKVLYTPPWDLFPIFFIACSAPLPWFAWPPIFGLSLNYYPFAPPPSLFPKTPSPPPPAPT